MAGPEESKSVGSMLRALVGMETQSEKASSTSASTRVNNYAEVAGRFAEGGCSAISSAEDKRRLQEYQAEPSTLKVKIPGNGQLQTAVGTCKGPTA